MLFALSSFKKSIIKVGINDKTQHANIAVVTKKVLQLPLKKANAQKPIIRTINILIHLAAI
jgi:hypothetical protein